MGAGKTRNNADRPKAHNSYAKLCVDKAVGFFYNHDSTKSLNTFPNDKDF
jgi:hypothetical protein